MSLKDEKEKNKDNRNRLYKIIIFLLVVVIILLLLNCCAFRKIEKNQLIVDCNSEAIDIPKHHISNEGTEMTEIVGFDNLLVDANNPSIYLVNPKANTVYLQYDIYYNDKIIYSTDLIPPDRMMEIELYSILPAGNNELIYMIDSFDLETQEECLSNIKQIVKVKVEK